MFRIEMLPAREGDCLVVTWGSGSPKKRVLIDAGRKATAGDLQDYLIGLPESERQFELFVVTHIDRDHIEGALELLGMRVPHFSVREVWFNAFHHLHDEDFESFGPVQGEQFSRILKTSADGGEFVWNDRFGPDYTKAVALAQDGSLIDIDMGEGMLFTLLSPTRTKLQELIATWERECQDAGIVAGVEPRQPPPGFEYFGINVEALAPTPFQDDHSEANGSSIALLAQYQGKRALLSGDAHEAVLMESIRRFPSVGPLHLDFFKLPHHGSRSNLSRELLEAAPAVHYAISTNGAYFNHPDPVAMSRLLKYGKREKQLWFNYASPEALAWDNGVWKQAYAYETHYPTTPGRQLIDLL